MTFHLFSFFARGFEGLVSSLWHCPYSAFHIYDRARAVSSSPFGWCPDFPPLYALTNFEGRVHLSGMWEHADDRENLEKSNFSLRCSLWRNTISSASTKQGDDPGQVLWSHEDGWQRVLMLSHFSSLCEDSRIRKNSNQKYENSSIMA